MESLRKRKRVLLLVREKEAVVRYYLEKKEEDSNLNLDKKAICIKAANIFSVCYKCYNNRRFY